MKPRRRRIPRADLALGDAKDLVRCVRKVRRLFIETVIDSREGCLQARDLVDALDGLRLIESQLRHAIHFGEEATS